MTITMPSPINESIMSDKKRKSLSDDEEECDGSSSSYEGQEQNCREEKKQKKQDETTTATSEATVTGGGRDADAVSDHEEPSLLLDACGDDGGDGINDSGSSSVGAVIDGVVDSNSNNSVSLPSLNGTAISSEIKSAMNRIVIPEFKSAMEVSIKVAVRDAMKESDERHTDELRQAEERHEKQMKKLKMELLKEFRQREVRIVQYLGSKINSLEQSQLLSHSCFTPYPVTTYKIGNNVVNDSCGGGVNNNRLRNNKSNTANTIINVDDDDGADNKEIDCDSASSEKNNGGISDKEIDCDSASSEKNNNCNESGDEGNIYNDNDNGYEFSHIDGPFRDESDSNHKYVMWKSHYDSVKNYLDSNDGKYPAVGARNDEEVQNYGGGKTFDLRHWIDHQKKNYNAALSTTSEKQRVRGLNAMTKRRIALLEDLPNWTWSKKRKNVTRSSSEDKTKQSKKQLLKNDQQQEQERSSEDNNKSENQQEKEQLQQQENSSEDNIKSKNQEEKEQHHHQQQQQEISSEDSNMGKNREEKEERSSGDNTKSKNQEEKEQQQQNEKALTV